MPRNRTADSPRSRITVRVDDDTDSILAKLSKELMTKAGRLTSIIMEASSSDLEWLILRRLLTNYYRELSLLNHCLNSARELLRQRSCEQNLPQAQQQTLDSLVSELRGRAQSISVIQDLLQGISAGRAPSLEGPIRDLVKRAQLVANQNRKAKNGGRSVSSDVSNLAIYLAILGILKRN
jgi:hypothetical protein